METIKTDEYGEVVNAPETYTYIAKTLKENLPVLVGWTDEEGSHIDILFVFGATQFGSQIQRGIKPNDLFVSVMGVGAHGFKVDNEDTHPGYISEKFGDWFGSSSTGDKFAELVNGIKKELTK